MFRHNYTTYLPLLISGLPVFVTDWLRTAGVPAVPMQSALLCRKGKNAAGQILVFDARDATSRLDARMARENGAQIINVADLLSRKTTAPAGETAEDGRIADNSQSLRAAFLNELKLRIEGAGGFWLRIADYPFPYQSVLCSSVDPEQAQRELTDELSIQIDDNRPVDSTTDDRAGWVEQRYTTGQPIFYEAGQRRDNELEADPLQLVEADEHPLMWHTSIDELLRWHRLRKNLVLTATKKGSTYRIQWAGSDRHFRPTVELWLGHHVASLPLADDAMTVREEGVLFVQEHRRHPAGVAAGWCSSSHRSHVWELTAHHSV